jgi:hypothetical protein
VLEQRRLETPPGYFTEVTASVEPGSGPTILVGQVAAFGAAAGECLAVIYATQATGPGADMAVGTRLAAFVGRVLPAMQRLTLDDLVRATQTRAW